ncbi:Putative transport protein [hydrothermal vent metagenome]|uniref:Putative transport protein n=1 Tax=hydrothermal vent metagenome TaxID=652676 RepID=A0A1W1BNI0_9ZZZZ
MNHAKVKVGYLLMVAASVIIILAGVKMASVIVVPFLLSIFLAIILAPLFLWLKRLGLGEMVSLTIIVISLLFIVSLLVTLVGNSVQDFNQNIPIYELKLRADLHNIFTKLDDLGVHIPQKDFMDIFQSSSVMKYIANTLKSLGSLLTSSFMIILTVVFMLMEISQFTEKLNRANSNTILKFTEVNNNIKHYMMIKALTSAVTGLLIAVALKLLGIHYAILWGLLAFALNFIPNIGSIIASIPAILMAIIQYDLTTAAMVGVVYLIINVIIGSILEPRILGRGLGLSPLIILLSLIFWGWLLGPLGMLLSVPLTVIIKIALDTDPNTKWLAIILSSGGDLKSIDTDKR